MELIRFKYRLPDNLVPLVQKEIVDWPYDYLYGMMEPGIASQLRNHGLYMICELEVHNNRNVYKNPVAVVAKNENEAIRVYHDDTGKENGLVFCEIVNRCDKITVEAV